jgi:hypothetical protein
MAPRNRILAAALASARLVAAALFVRARLAPEESDEDQQFEAVVIPPSGPAATGLPPPRVASPRAVPADQAPPPNAHGKQANKLNKRV